MEGDDGPSAISNKPTIIKGIYCTDYLYVQIVYMYVFSLTLCTHELTFRIDFRFAKIFGVFRKNHTYFFILFFHFILLAAQEEMGRLDVLVCGQCHTVFHFIEEFQEHRTKAGACSQVSHFRENNDVSIHQIAFSDQSKTNCI